MSRTFIFILLMLLPLTSRSQTVEWDGVVYEIDTSIGEAKVVKATNHEQKEYPILESLVLGGRTYPVTSIETGAFWFCYGMESLSIPKYVVNIGIPLFYYLYPPLSSIEVAPENPKYDSRNGCNALMETSTNTLLLGSNNTIIPNNVTGIAQYAFAGLKELKSLSLPNSVTRIEEYAFAATSNLTDVRFSDSLTFLGDFAFYNSGLTTIRLPNSLRHIGDFAFLFCGDSPSYFPGPLTLPDSMDYMGRGAFWNSKITSAVIPKNLKSIREGTFYNCRFLTSVTIPETVINMADSAFLGCGRLSDVTIHGSSLQSIGHSAFKDCTGLSSINVPNSVREIGDSAFLRCKGLSSINIPADLSEIRNGTFSHCGLESIIIPNSVKRIGKSAFAYCKLSTAKLPDGLESIEDSTFHSCKFSRIIPPTMAEEGGDSCLILPPSLKHIGKYAFADNRWLTCIILPNSLKTIGYMAFSNYTYTHRILKTVVIPSGVEEIGEYAFIHAYYYSGQSLVDDLKDVYCYIETPLDCYSFSTYSDKTLHVPAQSVRLYRNHKYWGRFKEIVPLTNEETGVRPTMGREPDEGIHYSLSGTRISPESKGIHVVRYNDGTVRKVICK
ncbi:MAG: leucine-rich repeat domain-containing protein [Prevotella sp.]|nr:leucine-rich repeat domain-containing protein [Prevotella sp.]